MPKRKIEERDKTIATLTASLETSNIFLWITLSLILLILVAVVIWSFTAYLNTTLPAVAIADDNAITCYVSESQIKNIREGMSVEIEDQKFTVIKAATERTFLDDSFDDYFYYVSHLERGSWGYEITLDGRLEAGTYRADIYTDSLHPSYFVFN